MKPWEPQTVDFCTTRFQLRQCSQNEVVEVEIALSQSEASQLSDCQETAFAGWVRERRGEVRVSTLTAEEKLELARDKQSEINSFMKHAAVQAATRPSVRPTVLMRMRLVITRKPDPSLKSTRSWERNPASPRVSRCGRQLCLTVAGSQRMRVFKADCKDGLFEEGQLDIKIYFVNQLQNCNSRWAGNTTNAYNYQNLVQADGCTTRVVGKSRERHDKSMMENLDKRAMFLGGKFV